MIESKTQVAIIGGGPSGMLLSLLLHQEGIDNVVLERSTREHVLSRIRAGVLEWSTVELLRRAGLGERMDREGHVHNGTQVAWGGEHTLLFDINTYTGRHLMAYGQTAITEDLYQAHDALGSEVQHQVDQVELHELTGRPFVTYTLNDQEHRLDCDSIAGCDGFHGVSRGAIPASVQRNFEKVYPFGWLGVLSETPPLEDIWYIQHPDGFALASQRNPMLSRYYVQCDLNDRPEDWSDQRFWQTLLKRMPPELAAQVVTGPSIEKSIAPLRSFVTEPMRYGQLFLVGDAAHIVPPTGAKGLNLAMSDVYYLWRAMVGRYRENNEQLVERYSQVALKRVWDTTRFSWWVTTLLHRFPDQTDFDMRTRLSELQYLSDSPVAMHQVAEQYGGFPIEDWG